MIRLVAATANPNKVVEIEAILRDGGHRIEMAARPAEVPDVVEDGETLLDNARLKAEAIVAATGEAAIADDTGLEVDALGGLPGVRSARYAGEQATSVDNVAKLLAALGPERDDADRSAQFRTVVVVRFPDGREIVAEGTVRGTIAVAPVGDGGFGYDPVFVPSEGDGRTFAQMSLEDKNRISHRARALTSAAAQLASL